MLKRSEHQHHNTPICMDYGFRRYVMMVFQVVPRLRADWNEIRHQKAEEKI